MSQSDRTAWSPGGRTFAFEGRLASSSDLAVGALVLLTAGPARYLGQIIEKGSRPDQSGDHPVATGHAVVGRGILLARLDSDTGAATGVAAEDVFDDATVEPAPAELVREWLGAALGSQATLPVGALRYPAGEPAHLVAAGFNRHTFLCGQSGSGKTYALGGVLEQLLIGTTLRMLVLDPNSDYVNLDQLQGVARAPGAEPGEDDVCVFRSGGPGRRLRVRFGRLPLRQQAMTLDLDPLHDADEYDLMRRLVAELGTTEYSLHDLRGRLPVITDPVARRLALRIDNLGVADWSIWAADDQTPIVDQLPPHWRAAVLDLGDLSSPEERSVVAASVMSAMWASRLARDPLLIVIDEAHNVCPLEPASTSAALAVEHTERIAAEGRKYGLYLLLATQSPRKLPTNVLTQCENLLLMKTNSAADLDQVADAFSHVPRGLVAQAAGFRLGEGLAAGRIVPAPQLFTSGRRLSPEGGADVPTDWAERRAPAGT